MHINRGGKFASFDKAELFLYNRTIYVNAFSSYYRNKSKKVPSSSECALIINILKDGNTMEHVTDCFHNQITKIQSHSLLHFKPKRKHCNYPVPKDYKLYTPVF